MILFRFMPAQHELSEQLTQQINHFIETVPVNRLNRNLRNLIFEHLAVQKDGYSFNLEDLLTDTLNLFDLLESMEQNTK